MNREADQSPLQRSVEVNGDAVVLTGKAPQHFTGRNHPGGEHSLTFSDEPDEGLFYTVAVKITQA